MQLTTAYEYPLDAETLKLLVVGKALPFFHSVRMKIRRTNVIMEKNNPIGQEVEIKVNNLWYNNLHIIFFR